MLWGCVTALVALVALTVFLATRPQAPGATSVQSPLLGHAAPGFSARTLGGATVSLASERGHVVVLNFWASWCEPCQQEAPTLSTFAWQERVNQVVVLGVVWQDDVSSAQAFQAQYGLLFPSVVDPDGQIANDYGVTGPPTTFVINAQGKVVASLVGATTDAQLTTLVEGAGA